MTTDLPGGWIRGAPTAIGSYWICHPDQSGKHHVVGPVVVYRKLGRHAGALMDLARTDRETALREVEALPLWVKHGDHEEPLTSYGPCAAHLPYFTPLSPL